MFEDAPEADTRRGIQSVEHGFGIIKVLAAAPGRMSLKILAEQAGMSPSKAHLYLVSFLRLGLVIRDSSTSHYGLGPAALQLGIAAINQLDVVDLARERLPVTIAEAQTPVSLAVWGNRGATVVYRIDYGLPVPLSVRVGYVLPLLTTATGHTFMAHLPERVWGEMAKQENKMFPGRLARALDDLPEIRERLLTATVGETHTGFFGVASPIFHSDDSIAATVTALGLTDSASVDLDGQVARAVITTAARISRDLGSSRYDNVSLDAPAAKGHG